MIIRQPRVERMASQVSDVGLALCLFVTPLLLGGRHDIGRLVYVAGAALAVLGAIASGVRTPVPKRLVTLIALAIGLVALQVTPLPQHLLNAIGPNVGEILPLWGDDAPFGPWRTLSVNPSATTQGLALLIAHSLVVIAVIARTESLDDVRKRIRWVAYAAVAMAFLGFLQYVVPNGKVLWLYDYPYKEVGRQLQGGFVNKNHFAHFLILGIGAVVWLAMTSRTPSARGGRQRSNHGSSGTQAVLWTLMVALLVVGILASQSRGGMIALIAAALVIAPIAWRIGRLNATSCYAGLGVVLLAIGGLTWFGYEETADRYDDVFAGRVDQVDANSSRRLIWKANLDAFNSSPWFGYGAGTHMDVYPMFFKEPFGREFTHAESGYMQVASEMGGSGLLLLGLLILMIAETAVVGLRQSANSEAASLWLAVLPGLVGSAIHSVVDFVWYLPGLMGVTCVLVGCALRLGALAKVQEQEAEGQPVTSSEGWQAHSLGIGVAAALASVSVTTFVGPALGASHWDRYLRSSIALRAMTSEVLDASAESADPYLADTIKESTLQTTLLLQQVLANDTANARAHLRLAGRLLQRYEAETYDRPNGMTLDLIRDAAMNGGFDSYVARQEWLNVALGSHADLLRTARAHAEAAVRCCPLQGEGYLYLAQLDFLAPSAPSVDRLVDQAIRVRPYDGGVLFEAGQRCWIAGEPDKSVELWRRAVHYPGSHQLQLVGFYASAMPAAAFLEDLDPGLKTIDLALKLYRRTGRQEDLVALCERSLAEAREAEKSGGLPVQALAHRWRQVSATLRSLDRYDEAVESATKAVEMVPYDFSMRLELATAFVGAEQFDEADPHLRWCLARRPDLRHLSEWLKEGTKRRTEVDRNRRGRIALYKSTNLASGVITPLVRGVDAGPPPRPSDAISNETN